MISFLLSFAVLFAGYMLYGRFAEHIFAPDDRITPAIEINDGVDCIPMKTWKAGSVSKELQYTKRCGIVSPLYHQLSPFIIKCRQITVKSVFSRVETEKTA